VQKSKLYGLIGSTLSSTIILLVLWLVVLSAPSSIENEGFLVSFGDDADGGGSGYVSVPSRGSSNNNVSTGTKAKTVNTSPASTTTTQTSSPEKQTVFTQTDNSVALNEQKEKARVSKIQTEINNQRIETEKRKADQSRKEQVAINNANAVNGLFGNNGATGGKGSGNGSGTGTGKGTGSGSGNGVQGNPAGKGATGVGSTFRLGNRSYYGNPAKPNYPKDVEGKITVIIRVDEKGTVTSSSIGTPTTIIDSEMRRDAISAANKTRFTAGKGVETGSITYNYKLE